MNAPEAIPVATAAELLPLTAIAISKTNPRKSFDQAALDELAASVKRHGVLQPILVRYRDGTGQYEVVAGERRYRAAKAAGLSEIPALVRRLSDVEMLELQLVENLQRADLHPLEEAEGYEQLVKLHRFTAEELAAKVGKSKGYVYARLKLCALCPEARKAFYDDKLDASRALLIARIGHHDTQRKALKDVTSTQYGREPMSYREAHQHLLQNYMLALKSAPFDITDAALVPKAGACGPCPKRTGNQTDLFGDVKSADVCTDPKCFDDKRQAHHLGAVRALEAKGKKVLYGDDAKKAFPNWDENSEWQRDQLSDRYVPMSGHAYVGYHQRAVRELLGEEYKPLLIQHPATGKILEVATKAAVEAAAKEGKSSRSSKRPAKAKPKAPDIDDVLTERLAKLIHEKAPKQFGKSWLVALSEQMVQHFSTRDLDAVALAWGWKSNAFRSGSYSKRLASEASKLGERDLVLLMFHLVFAIGQYTREPVLKLFGIHEQRVREQIIQERRAAAKKARDEAKTSKPKKISGAKTEQRRAE